MKKSQKKALYSIPGWEEFLSEYKIEFRHFEEARAFARNLNLNGREAWRKWSKSNERPNDIPSNPQNVYKDSGWIGYGDFLGTGNIAPQNREFRSFEDARKFAHKLGLKSQVDWKKWSKSNKRPKDIPSLPSSIYKDSGWVSWGDFLGTGNTHKKDFRSFEDARKFAHKLGLKSQVAWEEWCKSGKKPDNIPSTPQNVYKDSGWIGYGDFLGTGNLANRNRSFRSFKEARKFARNLKLNTKKAWKKWSKSSKRPDDIPSRPDCIYKDLGWVGFGDFLGTGNLRGSKKRDFRSFEKARTSVCNLELNSQVDWFKWSKSNKRPKDIPSAPDKTYKDAGWISWGDWLGTGRIRRKKLNENDIKSTYV